MGEIAEHHVDWHERGILGQNTGLKLNKAKGKTMAAPVKTLSLGKAQAAVFAGKVYDGKPSYSIKFQKVGYDKTAQKATFSEFFSQADLRDLSGLVIGMLSKQIKEWTPKVKQATPETPKQPDPTGGMDFDDNLGADGHGNDEEVPF